MQLGDSHTAADLFSGELRKLLQARYGDGGIGLVPASPVPGIRSDRVIITSERRQWELVSARNQQSERFPLGGYLSTPLAERAAVNIQARDPDAQRYRISAPGSPRCIKPAAAPRWLPTVANGACCRPAMASGA